MVRWEKFRNRVLRGRGQAWTVEGSELRFRGAALSPSARVVRARLDISNWLTEGGKGASCANCSGAICTACALSTFGEPVANVQSRSNNSRAWTESGPSKSKLRSFHGPSLPTPSKYSVAKFLPPHHRSEE